MRFSYSIRVSKKFQTKTERNTREKEGKLDHNLQLMGIDAHLYSQFMIFFRTFFLNFFFQPMLLRKKRKRDVCICLRQYILISSCLFLLLSDKKITETFLYTFYCYECFCCMFKNEKFLFSQNQWIWFLKCIFSCSFY